MRILVLTSRYTATRDIIDEDFGRQTRLFSALKKLGHVIDFFVADYRKYESRNKKLHGINAMIRPFGLFHFFGFLKNLDNLLKAKKYDYLIATSDPLWGAIGYYYAKKHHIIFVYDLHDNYETYSTYNLLLFGLIDNHTLKNADVLTVVSQTLKDKIKNIRKDNVFVIQNGFDDKLFRPLDRQKCRKLLGLPENGKIIAYAGSIQRLQGIHIMIDAFKILKKNIPDVYLAIAGRFYGNEEKHFDLKQDNMLYLGSLEQDKIPLLINAADVAVVPNTDNNFTRYCFPYKVVEYMACNVPIVATGIGDVGKLLSGFNGSLCKPDDADDMAEKIKMQLNKKMVPYRESAMSNTWNNIAKKLDNALKRCKR